MAVMDDPGGQSAAINLGIARAQPHHEYVNWLGDDDTLTPGSLAAVSHALDARTEASAAFGQCQYVDPHDQPVWSIVCFYIDARRRRRGVAKALLAAAIDYARMQGALILEAYPNRVEGKANSNSIYMGTESMFAAAGFVEVARRNADRPVMRLAL